MMQKNDVARIYDTVLSIPGMNEKVKVGLQITRKNLLLLNKLIEKGLNGKDADDKSMNILEIIDVDSVQELKGVARELLDKAGLTEVNEKLQAF